jgi:hypothetical protein
MRETPPRSAAVPPPASGRATARALRAGAAVAAALGFATACGDGALDLVAPQEKETPVVACWCSRALLPDGSRTQVWPSYDCPCGSEAYARPIR